MEEKERGRGEEVMLRVCGSQSFNHSSEWLASGSSH